MEDVQFQPRMIGIGGGSGAGKTTLVRRLADRFGPVCVVDLDSYYLDRSGLDPEKRASLNYDEPGAFDVPLLLDHLRRLRAGEAVAKPQYSFESHTRVGAEKLLPAPLILIEGLFVLWWRQVRACLDLRVFVEAPADLRLGRRVRRDVGERGRSAASVLSQYLETVRPMHERYVEPTRAHADLVVENNGAAEVWEAPAVEAVRALLGRQDNSGPASRLPVMGKSQGMKISSDLG